MKYELVVFDFDYTLADASDSIVESFYYALGQIDVFNVNSYDIRRTIGMSLEKSFIQLTHDYDETKFVLFRNAFIKMSDKLMTPNTKFYCDTKKVLMKLRKKGIKLAIVTSKFHKSIVEALKKDNLENFVDIIVGGDDVSTPKPNPECLNKVLKMACVDKKKTLYVGDSIVDAIAAEQANIDFIGVTTGMTLEEELQEHKNVYILNRLSGVLPHVIEN